MFTGVFIVLLKGGWFTHTVLDIVPASVSFSERSPHAGSADRPGDPARSQGAQGFSPRDFPTPEEFSGAKRARLDSDSQSDELRDTEWCRRQVSHTRALLTRRLNVSDDTH